MIIIVALSPKTARTLTKKM